MIFVLKIIFCLSLLISYEFTLAETRIALPQQTIASNAAVKIELNTLHYFDSLSGVEPLDHKNHFLVIDITLVNAISPELVFDHDIAEKLVFHNLGINGPFLQWGSEQVFGRIDPKRFKNIDHFPDPAYLNFEGDSLSGKLIYEVPRKDPKTGATLLWPDSRFDLLALDLFKKSETAKIDPLLYKTNGEYNLRVHDVDIQADGVSFSLSGYRNSLKPTIMSEKGTAQPLVNLSLSSLFVDGAAKKPKFPGDTTPVVFVSDRVLTHKMWYPNVDGDKVSDLGLVIFVQPPKHIKDEPHWIIPIKGKPSMANYTARDNKIITPSADKSLENDNKKPYDVTVSNQDNGNKKNKDTAIYLNIDNISVTVGAGTSGSFNNTFMNDNTIDKVIGAKSADAKVFHDQSTHIWFTANKKGAGLELFFDFGKPYNINTLHFWNFTQESYDVDNIHFTFYDKNKFQIGSLLVEPALGSFPGILSENINLCAPLNVHYVKAFLTGSNGQVDFQNIGFTSEHSQTSASLKPECKQKPGTINGRLSVRSISSDNNNSKSKSLNALGAIEVIFDASGSMWKKMPDGKTRIEVARSVLSKLITESMPDKVPFALRVFGNRKARSCRTDLEYSLKPLNRNNILSTINKISPKNRSKTPIAKSLSLVKTDLENVSGNRIVILLTDGKETCNGDPKKEIEKLKALGIDIQINIVGFAIDDKNLQKQFKEYARIGGGEYFNAANEVELRLSLDSAVRPMYKVYDYGGNLVAEGRVNDDGHELLPGEYRVEFSDKSRAVETIEIISGKDLSVEY